MQFSSTRLLNEYFSVLSEGQRDYLKGLGEQVAADDVLGWLDRLKSTRVMVVGEAIIDEYHYCVPDAMSNKTPTLSARFESAESFAGGVVAVGNHLVGLAGDVHVLACGGTDDDGETAFHAAPGVRVTRMSRSDAPTVRKRRFVHRFLNQKLFEVTFLDDRPIDAGAERVFLEMIDAHAPGADVVIVLDFGHGFFTPRIVERLRERSSFLAVNAQINSSNKGFNSIRKYRRADYISVDEYEMRLPYGDRYGELGDLIQAAREETGCQRINVTLGDRGSLYFDGADFHRAPILTNRTVDALGAGDAFLAVTAPLVHAGAPGAIVPFVGNCMGGLMAQIVGHRTPVDAVDLKRFIGTLLK